MGEEFKKAMLISYLLFLKESETDEEARAGKIVKAVEDFYIDLERK